MEVNNSIVVALIGAIASISIAWNASQAARQKIRNDVARAVQQEVAAQLGRTREELAECNYQHALVRAAMERMGIDLDAVITNRHRSAPK